MASLGPVGLFKRTQVTEHKQSEKCHLSKQFEDAISAEQAMEFGNGSAGRLKLNATPPDRTNIILAR
jgi:hypothetical protein